MELVIQETPPESRPLLKLVEKKHLFVVGISFSLSEQIHLAEFTLMTKIMSTDDHWPESTLRLRLLACFHYQVTAF